MKRGEVARKMEDRGFGFIRAGSKDYFFHMSQCTTDFNSLELGDQVEFEVEDSPKGHRAVNVQRVEV